MLSDLSDVLLGGGALAAAAYCLILARRLRRFGDLEGGVGGAVAVLSAQVDDLTRTLRRAEAGAAGSVEAIAAATGRAEAAGRRIELLLASLHDLPDGDRGGAEPQDRDAPEGGGGPAVPVFVRHPLRSDAGAVAA